MTTGSEIEPMTTASHKPGVRGPGAGPTDARRRYLDQGIGATVIQVLQGDCYVSAAPDEVLTTVLGSCVSACVRDPVARCGGMNHFLLPAGRERPVEDIAAASLRYGSFAMEQLINTVMASGGHRERLEIKVFGGANVMRGMTAIGHRNADFVEEFLRSEGFEVAAQHLRGIWPRKIQFFPHSGQVRMRELKDGSATGLIGREVREGPRVAANPAGGTIELFD